MYELKTNTATRIAVGPLVDPTDGKTAETALTVTDLSVQLYQIKNDNSAVVRSQFAPTASGGNNDMALVSSSTDGMYDLELTAAQLNFLGNARITFYDVDGFLVHWIDILVVSAAYFDWKYGSTIPDVNTTKIGGTSQTAKDLGALEVTNINTLAGHDPGATLVKVADLGTVQTGDAFARLGAPAGASVSADIAGVKAETASILEDTGTTLDGKINTIDDFLDTEITALINAVAALPTTAPDNATITAINAAVEHAIYGLAALKTLIDEAKAKTDKLTFTSGNDLDVNLQKINDVTIAGNGSTTPWGPAS